MSDESCITTAGLTWRCVRFVVPMGSEPGVTQLVIPAGHDEELKLVLPPMASPGDLLVFRSEEGSAWRLSIFDGDGTLTSTWTTQHTVILPTNAGPGPVLLQVDCQPVPVALKLSDTLPWDRVNIRVSPGSTETTKFRYHHAITWNSNEADPPAVAKHQLAWESLAEAVRLAGGFVSPKIRTGCAPPLGINGVFCSENIEKGELLVRIPERVFLYATRLCDVASAIWHTAEAPLQTFNGDGCFTAILSLLLHDSLERAITNNDQELKAIVELQTNHWMSERFVEADVWHVWCKHADCCLGVDFSQQSHVLAAAAVFEDCSANVCGWPQPGCSSTFDKVRTQAASFEKSFSTLRTSFPDASLEKFNFEMFLRAALCIISRSMDPGDSRKVLIPIFDTFNHSADAGLRYSFDRSARELSMHAKRCHAQGEEIYIFYGPFSNPVMYQVYGFTQSPQEEPSWGYEISKTVLADVVHFHFERVDLALLPDNVFLDSAQPSSCLIRMLSVIDEAGADPVDFLYQVCRAALFSLHADSRLQAAVEALELARASDVSSGAWWSHFKEDERSWSGNVLRVRMSEYLCVVAHLEAVNVHKKVKDDSRCLAKATQLRAALHAAFTKLAENDSDTE